MSRLDIQDLDYERDGFRIQLSAIVESGSLAAVIGPSGSGKTTLLRIIAGLESALSGTILLDGEAIGRKAVHQRGVGMVFQNYSLFPHMSVIDNVAYGPKLAGTSRSEALSLAREYLALVGLEDLADRSVATLSGGEQQRLALARSLAVKPRLLLMDEPLSALDRQLRERLRRHIRDLQRELGLTVIYVTHDQDEAMSLSDHLIVMRDGRIEQAGTPQTLYRRPDNEFVARFLGSANIIHKDGQTLAIRPESFYPIGKGLQGAETQSSNIAPDGPTAEDLTIKGRVQWAEFRGSHIDVKIETEQGALIIERPGDEVYREGEELLLAAAVEDVAVLRSSSR